MSEEETEKPQILIVDDSRVIRRAAFKMLSDDYLVHEAVDGMDGWQQLQLLFRQLPKNHIHFLTMLQTGRILDVLVLILPEHMVNELQGLTPKQAWKLINEDARVLLVDIRSSMEFLFVGHPKGAVHVPWIDEPDWVVNPHFVTEVRKLILGGVVEDDAQGSVPIILICRSGKRSKEAGHKLLEAGIANVYHIDEGFEGELNEQHHRSSSGGWRYHNLPWEQC